MNKYYNWLLFLLIASCAGADMRVPFTINTQKIEHDVVLKKKHHNIWLATNNEESEDSKIKVKAWVTNFGHNKIVSRYRVYDGTIAASGSCVPVYQQPLEINFGERKLFYVGPLDQLAMTFIEPPQDGAKVRIDVSLDEIPKKPIKCRFASSWGGP